MGLTDFLTNRKAAKLEKQGKLIEAIDSFAKAQNLPEALRVYHIAEKEMGKETMDNLGFGPFYEVSILQTLAVDLDFEPSLQFYMLDAYRKYSSGEYTDRNSNLEGRELGRQKIRQMFLRNAMRHNTESGLLQKLGFEGAEFAKALNDAEEEAYDVSSLENIANSYLRFSLCGASDAMRIASKLEKACEGEKAIKIYKKVRALEPELKKDCDYAISRCKEDCMPKTRNAAALDYYLGFLFSSAGIMVGGYASGNWAVGFAGGLLFPLALSGLGFARELRGSLDHAQSELRAAQSEWRTSREERQENMFSGVYLSEA